MTIPRSIGPRSIRFQAKTMSSGKVKTAVAVILLGGLITGCAPDPLPVLNVEPVTGRPALTQDQTFNVLDDLSSALSSATSSRDPNLLSRRLTGPALTVRTSQLEVAATRDDNEQITVIPDTFQQIIVPTTETWPRTMFAITASEQLQLPRLLALVQDSARDPYRLWGWVQLQPGVTMPAFDDPRVGSEEVPPNNGEGTLVMSPAEAIRQYADLLVNQEESAYVGNFQPLADDQLRFHLQGWRAAQETALQGERIEGTYTFTAEPAEGASVKAVRSYDGGAMVMGEIHTFERLEAMAGAVLAPQTMTAQALLYGQDFTNILSASYVDIIALYIPPAGSGQVVTLLGYSHIQTGASVSDPPSEDYPESEG